MSIHSVTGEYSVVKRNRTSRGRLLYVGSTGHPIDDSIRAQAHALWALASLFGIFLAIGVVMSLTTLIIPGIPNHSIGKILFWIIWSLGLIVPLFLALRIGLEIDGIYEKGVSNGRTTLIEHLRGKGFLPYESITAIRVEKEVTPAGPVDSITLFAEGKEEPAIVPFVNREYKGDFWARLENSLHINCPDADWVSGSGSAPMEESLIKPEVDS